MSNTQKIIALSFFGLLLGGATLTARVFTPSYTSATQNPYDPVKSVSGEFDIPDTPPSMPIFGIGEYCVVFANSEEGDEPNDAECFTTLEDAAKFVANNSDADKDAVILAMQGDLSGSGIIIGIEYDGIGYTGSILYVSATSNSGCLVGSWYLPTMPSNWNDRVSSAYATGYCTHSNHYSQNFYNGSLHVCAPYCSSMDLLDNSTSSIKFERK